MTRFWLIMREVVWASVVSTALVVASVVSVFVMPALAVPLGLGAIALAVLSARA